MKLRKNLKEKDEIIAMKVREIRALNIQVNTLNNKKEKAGTVIQNQHLASKNSMLIEKEKFLKEENQNLLEKVNLYETK